MSRLYRLTLMTEHTALNLVGGFARCCWCAKLVKIVKDSTTANAALAVHVGVDDLLCPMSGALLKVVTDET